jgi:SAM-dependent methyltransferase
MSQNIYDSDSFFQNYASLPRSVHGLAGAPEWPSLRQMLPSDLKGRRVLDLGCGYGWFARWAAGQGAREVVGVDLSERMLERARAMTAADIYPGVRYERTDLDDLPAQWMAEQGSEGGFDVVFSSLMLHYLVNCSELVRRVSSLLAPGGAFVLSVEHPIFTAPSQAQFIDVEGRRCWPLDGYQREGERVTDWLTPGVRKQHRTMGSYISMLLHGGFSLSHCEEWKPSEAEVKSNPGWAVEFDRPMFLLLAARKKGLD